MTALLSNKYVMLLSRVVLGTVFIVAAIDKIANPDFFAESIVAYKLLPYAIVNMFALIVPWAELLCGVFLIGGVFMRSSSLLLSLLLVMFLLAIMTAILRGLEIDCGCFGAAHATPVGWGKILEDIGLLMLAVHLFFYPKPVVIEQ